MKFCNDEHCPFHEIDPDNIVEEVKGQFGNRILGLVIRPLKPTVKDHLLFIPKEHHKYFHEYEPSSEVTLFDTETGEPYAKINGLAEGNKFNEM